MTRSQRRSLPADECGCWPFPCQRQSTTQFGGSSILRQPSHTALILHCVQRTYVVSPSHQVSALRTIPRESGSRSPLFVYLPSPDPSIPKPRQTPWIDRAYDRRPGLRAKHLLRASARHRPKGHGRNMERARRLANQRCHHGCPNGFGTYGLTPLPSNRAPRMADLSHPQRYC